MDFGGAGVLAQWLRILILEEELNSIPSIHMAAYKWSVSPVPGDSTPDVGWQEACVWCAFIQPKTCGQSICIPTIRYFLKNR